MAVAPPLVVATSTEAATVVLFVSRDGGLVATAIGFEWTTFVTVISAMFVCGAAFCAAIKFVFVAAEAGSLVVPVVVIK